MKDQHLQSIEEEVTDRVRQLKAVYHVHGREGLRGYGDGDVKLLLAAKRMELDETQEKLDGGNGKRLHELIKQQLSEDIKDLSGEMGERAAEREM